MIGYALASARTRCGALYPSLGPPPSDPSPDGGRGQTEASHCLTAAPVRDTNSLTFPTSGGRVTVLSLREPQLRIPTVRPVIVTVVSPVPDRRGYVPRKSPFGFWFATQTLW